MIADHERVLAPLMPKPEEMPFFLETAQQIGEIGLVPLHDVVALLRRAGDAGEGVVADAVLGAERLDHLERRLGQEDAAVAALAHQPQARAQGERVLARAAGDDRPLVQLGDEAVPDPLRAVGQREGEIGGGADDLVGADLVALRADAGLDGEEAVDALLDLEALEQEDVLAEDGVDRHQAPGLGVHHREPLP